MIHVTDKSQQEHKSVESFLYHVSQRRAKLMHNHRTGKLFPHTTTMYLTVLYKNKCTTGLKKHLVTRSNSVQGKFSLYILLLFLKLLKGALTILQFFPFINHKPKSTKCKLGCQFILLFSSTMHKVIQTREKTPAGLVSALTLRFQRHLVLSCFSILPYRALTL